MFDILPIMRQLNKITGHNHKVVLCDNGRAKVVVRCDSKVSTQLTGVMSNRDLLQYMRGYLEGRMAS